MHANEAAIASASESLWPGLLSQIPALADPALPLSDADIKVSRRYGLYRDVQSAEHFMRRIKVLEAMPTVDQLRALGELATAHWGMLITRGLQEWACLLAQDVPFATVARLLGWAQSGRGGATLTDAWRCDLQLDAP